MNLGKLEDLYLLVVFIIKKVIQILCVWHIAKTGGLLGVVCLLTFSCCVIATSYAMGKADASVRPRTYFKVFFIVKTVAKILCIWYIAKTGGLLGVVCLFAFSYCVIAISYAIGKTNSSIKIVKSKGYRKAMREQKQREFEENWPVLK